MRLSAPSRIATVASLVSAANILTFAVVGLGLSAVNTPRMIVIVPAWYFILFATVMVAVILVTWPSENRRIPMVLTKAPGFSLSSGRLASFGFGGALLLFSVVRLYDPLLNVFGPYSLPGWICLAAGILAYVRLQFDPPAVTMLTASLTAVPDPNRFARVASAVSMIAFLAMAAFCVVIIPIEQFGQLSLRIPPIVFLVQPVILALVFVASFWRANRWIPAGKFAGIRTITPLRLSLFAVVSGFVQLPVLFHVQPLDEATPSYYAGVILLFLIFAAGVVSTHWVDDATPMKPGKRVKPVRRPRGSLPFVYVGKLPQVDVAPVPGWVTLPYKFPSDGFANATAWANGMLPRFGAEIGTGTQAQKTAFARAVVGLINSRLKRNMGRLYLLLEEWDGPHLVAGMAYETSQLSRGMPVDSLEHQVAVDFRGTEPVPLSAFTTASGLEGHRRLAPGRVDYYVTVEGGWPHLSCEDEPARIAAALPRLDALASAIFVGDRVVGRRKKPVQ